MAFTDADCIADADWLRKIVQPLDDASVGIVGGRNLAVPPCNGVERFGEAIHDNKRAIEVFRPPYVITMNWCSPREVLERVGLFDERFQGIDEDVDLSYRIGQAGYALVYQPDAIVYHRNASTLPGLARKGFQHGFYSVQARKRHRRLLVALGHRQRVNGKAYVAIGSRLLDALRGVDRTESLCDAVFNAAKKLGKAAGAVRFGSLDL